MDAAAPPIADTPDGPVHGAIIPRPSPGAIRNLLGHKGSPWVEHLEDFLLHGEDGALGGLRWWFHVASAGDLPVANVCVWEARGAGLLGHVYTRPGFRRLGIARALMGQALAHASRRGVRAIALNADPGSAQEAFYASLGFAPVPGVEGAMLRGDASPWSGPLAAPASASAFEWGDWPGLNLAFLLRQDLPAPRWASAELRGPASLEFPLLQQWFGPRRPLLLVARAGDVSVGLSALGPGGTPGEPAWVLDFAAPRAAHEALLGEVRRAMGSLRGPVRWRVAPGDPHAPDPRAAGFEPVGGASPTEWVLQSSS